MDKRKGNTALGGGGGPNKKKNSLQSIFYPSGQQPQSQLTRKPKNRKNKVELVFDETKRKEFLTGFSKRKAERKRHFEEKLKKELKEERKKIRQDLREKIKKGAARSSIPELEHLLEPQTFDLPEHTVTITDLSETKLAEENLFLGTNTASTMPVEPLEMDGTKKEHERKLNRQITKKVQKSTTFKKKTNFDKAKKGKAKKGKARPSKSKKKHGNKG